MSIEHGQRIANYQRPVDLLEISKRGQSAKSDKVASGESFKTMFSRELAGDRNISFSKHAQERLYSRGINIDSAMLTKIADAVDRADQKGSKETLLLSDEAALVVSVKNRTVITAFDRNNLREGVITSIDSAVII